MNVDNRDELCQHSLSRYACFRCGRNSPGTKEEDEDLARARAEFGREFAEFPDKDLELALGQLRKVVSRDILEIDLRGTAIPMREFLLERAKFWEGINPDVQDKPAKFRQAAAELAGLKEDDWRTAERAQAAIDKILIALSILEMVERAVGGNSPKAVN